MKATEFIAQKHNDRALLEESKREVLAVLAQKPGDEEALAQLAQIQKEIDHTDFVIRSHEQALDEERRQDHKAARAAAEQARCDAAAELEKMGQEEIKLAKALQKAATAAAETLATLKELHARMMRTARDAGVTGAATQYLRLTGYDHALGALLERLGVRADLTLPASSVAFKTQTCEEVAADIADRMRLAAQSVEEKTNGR